jgi:hypothetical protein
MQERAAYCFPLPILVAVANVAVVSTEVATGTDVKIECPSKTVVEAVWGPANVVSWPSGKAPNALATRGPVVTGGVAPRSL